MSSNFGFLEKEELYRGFSSACLEAENSLIVSYATCAILTRRALELTVKWLFSYETELKVPYQETLSALIHDSSLGMILESGMLAKLRFIVKLGNMAAHTWKSIKREQVVLSLSNLYDFIDWVDYRYSIEINGQKFDEGLLADSEEQKKSQQELYDLYEELGSRDRKLEEIIRENEQLREEAAQRRAANSGKREYKDQEHSEYKTRKLYIDLELQYAGWDLGTDWREEIKVMGMPNASGEGFADYVLYGEDGKPLAVVEAKKTSVDARIGKQQAKLYADCLEQEYHQRPVIFYTNGFEYYIWDDVSYPARQVSGIYSKSELEWLLYKRYNRKPLSSIYIKDEITDRHYQKMAIEAVSDQFGAQRRKALLVMATGSGKTRVAISIVDVLLSKGWVKNVLFLADRRALVKQAKKNFRLLMPHLSLCNLLTSKDNPESRMVFSTYGTMMNAIDETKGSDGSRLFGAGHFDLIIIDESHRSIYKKYRAIFTYFDSLLLGLTATPRAEIDRNTYGIFDLEDGVPTYAYELEEAIENGYLVPYHSIETRMKFLEEGIHYDKLSEAEREEFENTFEDGVKDISSTELNKFLFNNNTIDIVLQDLQEKGLKVEGGEKLGKTIIFAANKKHAEFIIKRFDILYPDKKGRFAKPVYDGIKYVDSIIDDFSTKEKFPQIAISVDMLDTGIDVPEILNLVFFKRIRSKVKFWQMIGRGTRLCEDLLGIGFDKEAFRIFDYCSNFAFFRERENVKESLQPLSLTERVYVIKTEIVKALQYSDYQIEEYATYREEIVEELHKAVLGIDESKFNSRIEIKYIHRYNKWEAWQDITDIDLMALREHIAPLIIKIEEDELSKRFDFLMYSLEFAWLKGYSAGKPVRKVIATAESLLGKMNIPMVKAEEEIIIKASKETFWEKANILDQEQVRKALRELIKFLEYQAKKVYYTNFDDEKISVLEPEPVYGSNNLRSYRKKVNQYLRDHENDVTIYKLRHNEALSLKDVTHLEKILWEELGSRAEYEKVFGNQPLLKLVSRLVGLERQAAHALFSEFLSDESLNGNQREFVNLIVSYVCENGIIDKRALN
ncbi:MAG: DEAD/DEAH box helicase family protein, partial [Candidatus Stygibacter frigidus]|nr:DEAD/DEAH box helicase family protein [Candidatus Stygibacter frigidus]